MRDAGLIARANAAANAALTRSNEEERLAEACWAMAIHWQERAYVHEDRAYFLHRGVSRLDLLPTDEPAKSPMDFAVSPSLSTRSPP